MLLLLLGAWNSSVSGLLTGSHSSLLRWRLGQRRGLLLLRLLLVRQLPLRSSVCGRNGLLLAVVCGLLRLLLLPWLLVVSLLMLWMLLLLQLLLDCVRGQHGIDCAHSSLCGGGNHRCGDLLWMGGATGELGRVVGGRAMWVGYTYRWLHAAKAPYCLTRTLPTRPCFAAGPSPRAIHLKTHLCRVLVCRLLLAQSATTTAALQLWSGGADAAARSTRRLRGQRKHEQQRGEKCGSPSSPPLRRACSCSRGRHGSWHEGQRKVRAREGRAVCSLSRSLTAAGWAPLACAQLGL